MRSNPVRTQAGGARHFVAAREAFTVLELLVVISIVGLLTALILPAVLSARSAARRTQCQNHLHNLGVAMFSEAQAKRRFPASGNFSATEPRFYHSWAVSVLPHVDQKTVWREWDFDRPFDDAANAEVAKLTPPVFTCPDDATLVSGQSNLSYAVNGGFGWTVPVDCPAALHVGSAGPLSVRLDLNGNGVVCPADAAADGTPSDRDLFFRTGLFFLENWPPGSGTVRHHTLDTVTDGLTNTLMIAECVRAGYDPFAPGEGGWASPWPFRNSFFVSSYVCRNGSCSQGNVDYRRANERTQRPYRLEAINSGLNQAEGQAPWPASFHQGGVYVCFGDGRVQFLAEDIDGGVYGALVSPQGTLIDGPLGQAVAGGPL